MQRFFIICERDAGLFSLIQQVIANLPRALNTKSIPIVFFGKNCCYWVPSGYKGSENVWEYYFEPLLPEYASDLLPDEVKLFAESAFGDGSDIGGSYNPDYYLSNNFGDHSLLRHDCLIIPFEWKDPDDWLRCTSARLMDTFIRPRKYLTDRANSFADLHFGANQVIGVHIRGTDALSEAEPRLFRKNSLVIERYLNRLQTEKKRLPKAKIFVATDSRSSLEAIREVYGADVLSSATILHSDGVAAGKGPTGALMPAYIASDAALAAENGAEAVVDYLLLKKCQKLIHNGASLARTVLLSDPNMPHINTHRKNLSARFKSISLTPRSVLIRLQKWDERVKRNRKINFETWTDFISRAKHPNPIPNTKYILNKNQ
ncbi:hypothetical protein EV198_2914 [Roseivirga ehrenbergii]|uniref:Uncharacterized protein n=1 Tax=Roseivirga ehrenbergii (strain DSM 102268 / JCM 13514 / KCTC 12282 / NCIMB 14502 / KMM 6017) TaxID=279360 RepID=A0A150XQQ7_ROSEK|nr:hypothetical protein [Roseivirga ehrenbergii]KYG81031.1 hypothetical protein MB14_14725 [Roseivirga ehrenbergii]TCL00897.1 hypothetical protein EV198_2914 [Roseivirga ehrenbergii]